MAQLRRTTMRVVGLDLDLAGGKCIAGVAVDWSRCNDRVPLAILREVALRASLPA